ncbi:hypothetical protein MNBD_ALPHA02-212 [hydrothermal vent metagenome]|uniref:histidine kinase n=1 Tax=hydrothermal vent metagenome TaxID=652676 RepID=A0A3B0RHL4_9ZZZZ
MGNKFVADEQDTDILSEIINFSADAIISLDQDQNITRYNDAAEKIFGYSTAEVIGKSLNIILPESMHFIHKDLVKSYDKTEEKSRRMGQQIDLCGITKSGDKVPLDISIQKHPEGSSCCFTAICRDISYRLDQEKAIRENEAKFRMLFNTSHHIIIEMNGDGDVLEYNDTTIHMLKVKPQKDVGKKIWDCEFWASETDFFLIKEAVLNIKSGEDSSLVVNVLDENNQKIILDISLKKLCLDDGQSTLIVLEGKDITKLVTANKALVESQTRLAGAQKIARLGNWEWTMVSNEVTWSDEVYNIFGLEPSFHAPKYDAFMDMVHVEDREYVRKAIFDALKDLCPYNITHRIILADGTKKVVRQIGKILRTKNGDAVRMDGTIQDITEHWQREQELRLAKIRAEDADVAKAQFLSTVSHELRTPLNAIIGFGTLIADEVLGEINITTYRDYAEDIKVSGEALLKLVQNILHITSFQLGSLKSQPENILAREILDETFSLVSDRASQKNIKIDMHINNDIKEIYVDPELTRQILVHLIENAIKFSEQDSLVKVTLFSTENDFIIEVTDYGIGLDDTDVIFDLFVQENMDLNRVYEGIGLGLTIAKNLTEIQGGWIQVDSKVGQGSRFSVHFAKDVIRTIPDLKISHMA